MKARKRYGDILRILWKNPTLLHLLFDDEEWKKYEAKQEIPAEISAEMQQHILNVINSSIDARERRVQLKLRIMNAVRYASAAVLFIAMGWLGYTTFFPQQQVHDHKKHLMVAIPKTSPTAAVVWEALANNDNEKKVFVLPDSSRVTIYPAGTLKFKKHLDGPFRDVFLTGKAYFKVKRDTSRPFSVYAGGLKTTALGTSFTINTSAGRDQTSVRLHTGKIVVAPGNENIRMKPVYLDKASSGLLFDRNTQLASLNNLKPAIKPVAASYLNHSGSLITMRNIPLAKVIGLLNEAYQLNITADKKDIGNITYTGEVDTSKESIEQVLQVICLINNLEMEVSDSQHYTIKKIK